MAANGTRYEVVVKHNGTEARLGFAARRSGQGLLHFLRNTSAGAALAAQTGTEILTMDKGGMGGRMGDTWVGFSGFTKREALARSAAAS